MAKRDNTLSIEKVRENCFKRYRKFLSIPINREIVNIKSRIRREEKLFNNNNKIVRLREKLNLLKEERASSKSE